MDQRKRIDKILDAAEARIQDEVGTLLGTDFSVVGGIASLSPKPRPLNGSPGNRSAPSLILLEMSAERVACWSA